jgi:hypothetical protein
MLDTNAPDLPHEWQPVIDPDQPLSTMAPFGVDTALSETFSLFLRNFWLITRIVFVTVAPFEIFRAINFANIADSWEFAVASFLLSAACKVLVVPALIYALMKILLKGVAPGVHESYRWGLTKFVKLSICTIIVSTLQALGYALFIIPGIIVMLVFVLVYPIAVLEPGSVTEVFARSIDLTRGRRLQILAAQIVVGILLGIASVVVSFFIEGVTYWPVRALVAIANDVLDQVLTILSLVMYLTLPRSSLTGGHSVLSLKS